MEYITHSPEETEALGAEYAKSLKAGDVVAFSGDLGAGKTAFTRGVLHGLGYEAASPARPLPLQTNTKRRRSRSRTSTCTAFSTAKRCSRSALTNISTAAALCSSNGAKTPRNVLPEAYKTVHIAYGDADNDRRITIGEVTV